MAEKVKNPVGYLCWNIIVRAVWDDVGFGRCGVEDREDAGKFFVDGRAEALLGSLGCNHGVNETRRIIIERGKKLRCARYK